MKTAILSMGKWEITLRNLRAMKKEISRLKKRIKRLESKRG